MHRRAHRANLLARRVLAVMARHRLEVRPRRRQIAFEIHVDANPLHQAAHLHLVPSDHRNIVLRIAGRHARVAPHARVQIDRHAPRVLVVAIRGEHAFVRLRRPARHAFVRELRILPVLAQRRVADNPAIQRLIAFDRMRIRPIAARLHAALIDVVALRHADVVNVAGLPQCRPGQHPQCARLLNQIRVVANASRDPADSASLAQRHHDRIVRLPRNRQRSGDDLLPAHADLHRIVLREPVLLHGREAHQRCVVPRQVRHRPRNLLHPAHVRVAPVVHMRIGPERHFNAARRGRTGAGRQSALRRYRLRREGRAVNPSIVQRLAPVEFRIALRQRAAIAHPRRAHRVVGSNIRIVQQRLQDFMRRVPAVHRIDHRLHDAHRAVIGPRIRPHLEIVRVVDVPVRLLARFVQVRAQMHNRPNLIQRALEIQIRRRRIDGVRVQDHQPVHLAGVHVRDQRL